MAVSIRCPATRARPGHATPRPAGAPGLRGVGARPPVTTAGPLPAG
jgi:hypothetical protein